MSTDPFISVIITAYNRKVFLMDAIYSALNQSLEKNRYEILVVKNFTDNSIDGLIKSKGIRTILTGECSIGEMMSKGIMAANGDVISFLDDDDEFEVTKLLHVSDNFKDTEIVFYRNGYSSMNDDSNMSERFHRKHHRATYLGKASVLRAPMKIRMNMSCISVRKNLLMKNIDLIGRFKSAPDVSLFYIAASSKQKLILDSLKLTKYRYNPESVTHSLNTKNFLLQVETLRILENQDMPDFVISDIKKTILRISLITFAKGEVMSRDRLLHMIREYLNLKDKNLRDFISLFMLLILLLNLRIGSFALRIATSHGGNYE